MTVALSFGFVILYLPCFLLSSPLLSFVLYSQLSSVSRLVITRTGVTISTFHRISYSPVRCGNIDCNF